MVDGCRAIVDVESTMSSWSPGTLPTVKPEGKGRRWLEVDEIAEVEIFQRFQYVA